MKSIPRSLGLAIGLGAALVPAIADAHGIGQLYALPVPLHYYLGSATLVVALSFILFALFSSKLRTSAPVERTITVPGLPGILTALRILTLFLLDVGITAGIAGVPEAYRNFLPTYFWVYFLVGFAVLSGLVGNIFHKLNPWASLVRWLHLDKLAQPISRPAPGFIAPMLLIGLFWLELASGYSFYPPLIGLVLAIYSVITIYGIVAVPEWLERAEVFSVLFRLIGTLAFVRISDDDKSLVISSPVHRLKNREASWAIMCFLAVMLSGTSFDALRETVFWTKLLESVGYYNIFLYNQVANTVALVVLPALVLGLYLLAAQISALLSGQPKEGIVLAKRFAWALVPIGFGYLMAHNFGLLITAGPQMLALLSDPFGFGWNLFGTARLLSTQLILGAQQVWFIEIAFVVAAHIAGVWIAHKLALWRFKSVQQANISQIPLIILMLCFTTATLWLLSQALTVGTAR